MRLIKASGPPLNHIKTKDKMKVILIIDISSQLA